MSKDWNQDYIDRGIFAQRLYPNEALLQFIGGEGLLNGKRKHAKILEVGAGSGANLWMLAKEGHDAYGMDVSREALKIAERHLRDKWGVSAALKEGSFTDIPFEEDYFDYVIDVVSMQHIDLEMSRKALPEIRRVLKQNGKFFSYRLSDHNIPYFHGNTEDTMIDAVTLENISRNDLPLNNNGTISFWSPGLVQMEYRAAGLDVISIERNLRTYENGRYVMEYLNIVAGKYQV